MNDLISRQAVLDALDLLDEDWRNVMAYKVEKIPSAERKGKWEVYEVANTDEEQPIAWRCPNCEEVVEVKYNFCPECGMDMRGEEDE